MHRTSVKAPQHRFDFLQAVLFEVPFLGEVSIGIVRFIVLRFILIIFIIKINTFLVILRFGFYFLKKQAVLILVVDYLSCLENT
jgi:hypothetical protein